MIGKLSKAEREVGAIGGEGEGHLQCATGPVSTPTFAIWCWLSGLVSMMPDVISPEIMDEITRPQVITAGEIRRFNWQNRLRSASYGMGWRMFNDAGHTVFFHNDGVHGYVSAVAFLPKYKTGIVVLQNVWFDNHFVFEFFDM